MSEIHSRGTIENSVHNFFDPDKRIDKNDVTIIIENPPSSFDPDKRIDRTTVQVLWDTYDPDKRIETERPIDSLSFEESLKSVDEYNNSEKAVIYKDDNGNTYRIGKKLCSNSQYEINGYTYKTDNQGRIISAEGTLHLKDREGRLIIKDSIDDIGKGNQKETDDRGHLIGDQFDGSNGLENMIAQDANINHNDFKNLENGLAKEVKDGKEVYVKIEPIYDDDSKRPVAIVYTYTINGNTTMRVFPND